MIGLDTNVLLRYLVEDDPDQTARVVSFIDEALESGDRLFVAEIVLCEIVWVLDSVYEFSRGRIAAALGDLLRTRQVVIENPDAARRGLDLYAAGKADFADYLIFDRCRSNGCERLASFDGDLAGEDGVFSP